MPSEKARSLDHFYELLATGQHSKIELDFDVAADDFLKSPPSLAILARGSPGLTNDLLLRSSRRRHKHPARVVAADHRFVRIPLGHP